MQKFWVQLCQLLQCKTIIIWADIIQFYHLLCCFLKILRWNLLRLRSYSLWIWYLIFLCDGWAWSEMWGTPYRSAVWRKARIIFNLTSQIIFSTFLLSHSSLGFSGHVHLLLLLCSYWLQVQEKVKQTKKKVVDMRIILSSMRIIRKNSRPVISLRNLIPWECEFVVTWPALLLN